MFEHRTDWIAEGCDGPFNYYCWANRIGSEGFDGSTDFLKNAIANDSLKNIDEMIQKKKEKRRIQKEKNINVNVKNVNVQDRIMGGGGTRRQQFKYQIIIFCVWFNLFLKMKSKLNSLK
jgi:hypothetical protein